MLTSFLTYIAKQKLVTQKHTVLLAVSGGIDSVVMVDLFHKAGLKFAIAHCNFQLRNVESNEDEQFVKALAHKYNVAFHVIKFKTAEIAKKNKTSIQVTARELRYQWFEKIRTENKYATIATAHHLNDSIETFIINFTRGTGISGLHGILPKQGNVIRPLLFATKQEIENHAKKHTLIFREDSSNASDKYTRNKIRHHIVPVLKEINPNFENAFEKNIQQLIDTEAIYKNEIENKRASIVIKQQNTTTLSIKALKALTPLNTYLYEFLKPFDFNATTVYEIEKALDAESGKLFLSPTHRIIKDREALLIEKLTDKKTTDEEFTIKKNQKTLVFSNQQLEIKTIKVEKTQLSNNAFEAFIDWGKLEFPLTVRKWKQGDSFYPLGMKGKKKLSDFFIDKKLSLYQKENIWVLTSGNKIVWIMGLRLDERFKITEKSTKIVQINLIKNTKA
ncbi:MAG: tRNA lysidine(34) synthetase TilS [Bacteroidia bacterium]